MKRKITLTILLILILFLVGCSTNVIEIDPEIPAEDSILTDTEDPVEVPSKPVVTPPVETPPVEDIPEENTTHVVEVKENVLTPRTLTISVGDTVTWKNIKKTGKTGSEVRILGIRGICGGKQLESQDFEPGEEFSYTFEEAGECPYIDIYYTNSAGKITIE